MNGPGSLGVSQPKPFVYTSVTDEIRQLLTRRERWIFNNLGVIVTLTIHWLGPPFFLPWCSEAMLAIWSERLAKGPYQKNTLLTVRLEPAILRLQYPRFYPIALDYY